MHIGFWVKGWIFVVEWKFCCCMMSCFAVCGMEKGFGIGRNQIWKSFYIEIVVYVDYCSNAMSNVRSSRSQNASIISRSKAELESLNHHQHKLNCKPFEWVSNKMSCLNHNLKLIEWDCSKFEEKKMVFSRRERERERVREFRVLSGGLSYIYIYVCVCVCENP